MSAAPIVHALLDLKLRQLGLAVHFAKQALCLRVFKGVPLLPHVHLDTL
jgi:hypothetical protein